MRPLPLLLVGLLALPAAAAPKPDKWGFVLVGKTAIGERWEYPPMGVIIDVPKDYERVEPKKNHDVAYQFAMRHKTERYEVRYQFNTLGEGPQARKEERECAEANKKQPGSCVRADLSAPSETWLSNVVFNITERDVPMQPFPPQGVKTEFGADWGFVATPTDVDPRHDFNGDWKIQHAHMISKKGAGKVYRVALGDDIEVMSRLGRGSFYLARFKGAKAPRLPD